MPTDVNVCVCACVWPFVYVCVYESTIKYTAHICIGIKRKEKNSSKRTLFIHVYNIYNILIKKTENHFIIDKGVKKN